MAFLVAEIETRGDVAISSYNPILTPKRLARRDKKRARSAARKTRRRAIRRRRRRERKRERNQVFVVRGDFTRC